MDENIKMFINVIRNNAELVCTRHRTKYTTEYYNYKNMKVSLTYTKLSRDFQSLTITKM